MLKLKIILFGLILLSATVRSQTFIFNEYEPEQSDINTEASKSDATLFFKTDMELEFESSMEQLNAPSKENNKYRLPISERTCVITIRNKQSGATGTLAFGQLSSGSYNTLRKGEVKCFTLSTKDKLFCFDNTERQKSEGANDYQMQYKKEAMLIFNIDPEELNLEFSSSKKVTEVRKDKNRYLLYISPEEQSISITDPLTKATDKINTGKLKVKDVRYYYVSLPSYLRITSKSISSIGTKINDFLGYWGGNLGTSKSFIELQDIDVLTGKVKGKIYKDEVYYGVTGILRIKDENVFHITLNKQSNVLNNENATLDIEFKKNIGSGYWVSDSGEVLDITMMRTQNIPEDKTKEKVDKLVSNKRIYEGLWTAEPNNLISSIFIIQLDANNKVSGKIKRKEGVECGFIGKLKTNQTMNSLIITVGDNCNDLHGVLMLTISNGIAIGTYTSDDGLNLVSLKFKKNKFQ
jgi:hypothetical protein